MQKLKKWLRDRTEISPIVGFFRRFALIRISRLSVRIHTFSGPDITPFLHTHPFHYISLVMWGRYTELINNQFTVSRTPGSVIARHASTPHQIIKCSECVTLCIMWKHDDRWTLMPSIHRHPAYRAVPDGVYADQSGYRARRDGIWMTIQPTPDQAELSTRISFQQQNTTAEFLHAFRS